MSFKILWKLIINENKLINRYLNPNKKFNKKKIEYLPYEFFILNKRSKIKIIKSQNFDRFTPILIN